MEGNVNDLQPSFMNPTQEDPKTARTSGSHTDEPMRKRRSGSHTDEPMRKRRSGSHTDEPMRKRRSGSQTDASPVKTPEKDTTDDRCAESVCEASSSSGISGRVEESVRDRTTPEESPSEVHMNEDWERLRKLTRRVDADRIRLRLIVSMLEESRVIWHQRLMEIKRLKASRNGAWMDQNALNRVFQLWKSPLINADVANALRSAEGGKSEGTAEGKGKVEEGKAEGKGKVEEGKAEGKGKTEGEAEGKAEKGKAEGKEEEGKGKGEGGKAEGKEAEGEAEGKAEEGKGKAEGKGEEGKGKAEGKGEEGKGKAEGEAEEEKAEGKGKAEGKEEGKAGGEAGEGGAPQSERSERQKEFMIEYFIVLQRFCAQVFDTSPYVKLREIQAIKLQIEEETKDIRPSPDAPIA